mmetsp:Transcript_39969/g.94976  ORF Transcript_39969/g.94976 Transcript_39969/m.94976 type:complete len:282 (+) Transcript_39969:1671-2516(+)
MGTSSRSARKTAAPPPSPASGQSPPCSESCVPPSEGQLEPPGKSLGGPPLDGERPLLGSASGRSSRSSTSSSPEPTGLVPPSPLSRPSSEGPLSPGAAQTSILPLCHGCPWGRPSDPCIEATLGLAAYRTGRGLVPSRCCWSLSESERSSMWDSSSAKAGLNSASFSVGEAPPVGEGSPLLSAMLSAAARSWTGYDRSREVSSTPGASAPPSAPNSSSLRRLTSLALPAKLWAPSPPGDASDAAVRLKLPADRRLPALSTALAPSATAAASDEEPLGGLKC